MRLSTFSALRRDREHVKNKFFRDWQIFSDTQKMFLKDSLQRCVPVHFVPIRYISVRYIKEFFTFPYVSSLKECRVQNARSLILRPVGFIAKGKGCIF